MTARTWPRLAALTLAGALTACANPYALKVSSIDYSPRQKAGTVQVSDPKLYRREALINERREELTYLKGLIDSSTGKEFKPEIVRELEVVSTLSAALGLSFDPAAGLNYRRAKATSDLQQEINTLKLELELEKLKKEAELFRKDLQAQSAVSDANLGKGGDQTVGTPSSNVSAASAAQLMAAIDTLKQSLNSRLGDTTATAARTPSSVAANPADEFRDRAAYRSLLNSARNSASLDELHDRNASALMRLSFQATVLPPSEDYSRSLGVLRMSVEAPDLNDRRWVEDVYVLWLAHMDRSLTIWRPKPPEVPVTAAASPQKPPAKPSKKGKAPVPTPSATPEARMPPPTPLVQADLEPEEDPALAGLATASRLFDLAYYEYPLSKSDPKDCRGLRLDKPKPDAKCGVFALAAPRIANPNDFAGRVSEPLLESYDFIVRAPGFVADGGVSEYAQARVKLRSGLATRLVSSCQLAGPVWDAPSGDSVTEGLKDTVLKAQRATFVTRALNDLELRARRIIADHHLKTAANSDLLTSWLSGAEAARRLLDDLAVYGFAGCDPTATQALESGGAIYIPPEFQRIVTNRDARVAVYEVGPREQVQQLSTVARAADAIGLAAAAAGQFPGRGVGASANVGLTRAAVGKADALERAPLVVAFAEAPGRAEIPGRAETPGRAEKPGKTTSPKSKVVESAPAFGWLLGPRASLNPRRKSLDLQQVLKPYDLTVDLSVPGWWPYFDLKTETAWAPDWQKHPRQIMGDAATAKLVRVPLSPNDADMTALTSLLAGGSGLRIAQIQAIEPGKIVPCAETTLQITGDNIWRASSVVIGGKQYGDSAISVLPDMRGVAVTVKAENSGFPAMSGENARVTALTPYGAATSSIQVSPLRQEACPKPGDEQRQPPKPEGPKIAAVKPVEASVCGAATFTLTGDKLEEVTRAQLGAAVGDLSREKGKDGKNTGSKLFVSFSKDQMKASFGGQSKANLVLWGAKDAVISETPITLTVPFSCPLT